MENGAIGLVVITAMLFDGTVRNIVSVEIEMKIEINEGNFSFS